MYDVCASVGKKLGCVVYSALFTIINSLGSGTQEKIIAGLAVLPLANKREPWVMAFTILSRRRLKHNRIWDLAVWIWPSNSSVILISEHLKANESALNISRLSVRRGTLHYLAKFLTVNFVLLLLLLTDIPWSIMLLFLLLLLSSVILSQLGDDDGLLLLLPQISHHLLLLLSWQAVRFPRSN